MYKHLYDTYMIMRNDTMLSISIVYTINLEDYRTHRIPNLDTYPVIPYM